MMFKHNWRLSFCQCRYIWACRLLRDTADYWSKDSDRIRVRFRSWDPWISGDRHTCRLCCRSGSMCRRFCICLDPHRTPLSHCRTCPWSPADTHTWMCSSWALTCKCRRSGTRLPTSLDTSQTTRCSPLFWHEPLFHSIDSNWIDKNVPWNPRGKHKLLSQNWFVNNCRLEINLIIIIVLNQ